LPCSTAGPITTMAGSSSAAPSRRAQPRARSSGS
jgi:hypothetical protein